MIRPRRSAQLPSASQSSFCLALLGTNKAFPTFLGQNSHIHRAGFARHRRGYILSIIRIARLRHGCSRGTSWSLLPLADSVSSFFRCIASRPDHGNSRSTVVLSRRMGLNSATASFCVACTLCPTFLPYLQFPHSVGKSRLALASTYAFIMSPDNQKILPKGPLTKIEPGTCQCG